MISAHSFFAFFNARKEIQNESFASIPFTFAVMEVFFWIVCTVWLLSEVILNRSLRSSKTDQQNHDRHSLLLIWVVIIITLVMAVFIAARVRVIIYSNAVFQYSAIVIILLGVLIRIAAVRSLGKYFTVDVTIRQGHRLKENGMYTYVRHPSYAASLLSFIGFGIFLNNWLSLGLIVLAIGAVFIYRINVEEEVLSRQFGEEYQNYKSKTKRIIPFVY